MPNLQLTRIPSVSVGLLMRTPPEQAFEAVRDPAITTRFWYTRSTGPMIPGAELRWEWDMYGVSTEVVVGDVEENRRIAFRWNTQDPQVATDVEFRFDDRGPGGTYVQIIETGLSGDGDALVEHVQASTEGFTFVLSALKALLEHDLVLHIIEDAHPDQRVA